MESTKFANSGELKSLNTFSSNRILRKGKGTMRLRTKKFITSQAAYTFIITLVAIYSLLVLAVIAVEDVITDANLKHEIL